MPDFEETINAKEVLSPQEARFERWRNRAGFFLAPFAFLLIYFAPLNLKPEAHSLAAIIAVIIILWICESLPMPVTALIGAALCVLLKVAPAKEVFAPFADPLMFLINSSIKKLFQECELRLK
jgi:sodium-dependent dicarboxylate transporter 2/3/5